jgi:hypothetical protein
MVKGFNIPLVDSEEANRRLDICRSCPEFRKRTGTCKICNCIMKFKVRVPKNSCPLKKHKKLILEK